MDRVETYSLTDYLEEVWAWKVSIRAEMRAYGPQWFTPALFQMAWRLDLIAAVWAGWLLYDWGSE